MSPEEIEKLADRADPNKLWRRSGIDQLQFTEEQRAQLWTGVLLRRHASDLRQVEAAAKIGRGLLVTRLGPSVRDVRMVTPPQAVRARMDKPTNGS